MSVYVVTGSSSMQYESDYTWNVIAYLDESDALAHAERANQWAKDNGLHADESDVSDALIKRYRNANPHDPNMILQDCGVEYEVDVLDLL